MKRNNEQNDPKNECMITGSTSIPGAHTSNVYLGEYKTFQRLKSRYEETATGQTSQMAQMCYIWGKVANV